MQSEKTTVASRLVDLFIVVTVMILSMDQYKLGYFLATRVMPHFGQSPGWLPTTSGCIGQVY